MTPNIFIPNFADLARHPDKGFKAMAWGLCDDLRYLAHPSCMDGAELSQEFVEAALAAFQEAAASAEQPLSAARLDTLSGALANKGGPLFPHQLVEVGRYFVRAWRALWNKPAA